MSRRQLRRKAAEPSARNLRLVPDPPKPPRPRKRRRKFPWTPFKPDLRPMRAYEEALLLSVIRERGGYASVDALLEDDPGRWNPRHLGGVFKRLYKQQKLGRLARRHTKRTRYEIPKEASYDRRRR